MIKEDKMNEMQLCLWWFDTNWQKKGAAEHLIYYIDFENKRILESISYNIPQGINAIEVKRKNDIKDYVEALVKRGGFVLKNREKLEGRQ